MRSLAALIAVLLASPLQAVEKKDKSDCLVSIQRVYIEKLGGGDAAEQMRDMLIAAVQNSGLYAITENAERADAMVRGSAEDVTFTDEHHTSDTLGAHVQSGAGQTAKNHKYAGAGLTDNESSSSRERRHEAAASVRIVMPNGDVIWSTTQESSGARYKGAMADIADKIVKKLADDLERAKKMLSSSPQTPPSN